MIKLVAIDMDGTLLDSKKRLPPRLPAAVHALRAKGITLAIASGRQYYNLLANFPDYQNELLYICENGAMVYQGDTLLYMDEIPASLITSAVERVRSVGGYAILCGAQSAYLESDDSVLLENANMYYTRMTRVNDVLAVREPICKIAMFQHKRAEHELYPALAPCADMFQVVLSGESWVDLMRPGVDKGNGMRRVQKALSLTAEECMAFGDYPNDCEMMDEVYHSYAMANSHPDLRARCRFTAPSNDEDGVLRTLERELQLDFGTTIL